MTAPLLTVDNFTFSYDEAEKPVLHNLSFTVEQGEALLLLGPSGSGKSSLALCLNGLYPAAVDGSSTGEISLAGKKLDAYLPGEASRRIGVVFQDPDAQFCMLTVEDELAFGLENLNVPREEMADRMEWALGLVDLQNYRTSPIASLSGGMKQKLALACVLAMKPDLIILDEPTAMLDPVTTKELAETIKALHAELGFSLLVIEHKLDHWISFMDRCLIFTETGEVMFDGIPEDGFSFYLDELKEQGVWLPKPLVFSEQLNMAGKLPLTEDELLAAMNWQAFEKAGQLLQKERREYSGTILETRKLSFLRGAKPILKQVNVRLPKGALTAIVGPNGAGKSTLSYTLAGLETPDNGEVLYEKEPLAHLSGAAMSEKIGYVFQNPEHQFITDSVYEEIAFSLRMQKKKEADIEQIVGEILAACRLQGLAHQHPFSLSQGQKRRLSVATMLVDEQSLFILDEPTYGQDQKAAAELMKMVEKRLAAGFSAVMITHDMELVAAFADQVIVLVEGEVLFAGVPHDLFSDRSGLLEKAQLERPLAYSIREKWRLRGESLAASQA
ncbi:ATP-binding cassette domain-containing protein [Bacillus aerolatus]|uniref:ATP-binding cassette domain-containing protein n=1 Tax=Bacillus aerolatus TaxID=2653354 RepID=A0A6I1FFU3_9BACI|nr:ABC transporter ATP-binding protein [Bacillus aerolatus]KAB7707034.1 ATP-binding cassette domain-containing protein [Bacillus aerolatus]